MSIFGFPSHGSKIDRFRGSLAWIKNRPFSGFLGMDQKSTVFGVPWHGSKTTILQDSSHGPGAKRQKIARNGSGIDENQHNLVKTA